MAVHHIDDDSDAVLVADVDESLEIQALAKPLVDPEVADRQISPIHRTAHVRERHDLDGVDAEISQVRNPITKLIEIAGKLSDVNLVEDQVGEWRGLPLCPRITPFIKLVTQPEGGELSHPQLTGGK